MNTLNFCTRKKARRTGWTTTTRLSRPGGTDLTPIPLAVPPGGRFGHRLRSNPHVLRKFSRHLEGKRESRSRCSVTHTSGGKRFLRVAVAADDDAAQNTYADDTITVVATRTERSVDDVAATVSVKSDEEIDRELARNIADLVRFEPGVNVAGTGSRFGLTGFSIRGIGGNRVLTLIDGIRVPDEFSFGPFLSARRDFIDIDSLARAEIARGPISSLYGSDALGGVVALSTKGPRDQLGDQRSFLTTFKSGYSSVDESAIGSVNASGKAGPVAGMILYTRRRASETDNAGMTGGSGSGRERPDPQTIDLESLTAKVSLRLSDAHEFDFSIDRYANDTYTRILSDYGTVVFGTTVDRRDADDARRRHRWSLSYRYKGDMPIASRVSAALYGQRSETAQITHEDHTTRTRTRQTRLRASTYEQQVRGAWVQFSRGLNFRRLSHLITYGAEYTVTDNASIRDGGTFNVSGAPLREFSPLPTRDFPLTRVTQLAVFLQDEIALPGDRLLLTPGIRLDSFDADASADAIYLAGNPGLPTSDNYEDSQVTAKVGALYAFTDTLSAYARYSEGFRAPPYDDVNIGFANFLGGYKTIANRELDSERSRGLEVGARIGGNIGHAQVVFFRNDYDNFIESLAIAPMFLASRGIDPADGLLTFQSINRTSVEIWGWELSARVAMETGLFARGSLAFAQGKDRDTGQPLNSVDPLHGVLGLGYEAADGRWRTELVWTLSHGKDADDIDTVARRLPTPGYGLLDILTHVEFGRRVRLSIGLFNVTDKTFIRWIDTASIGNDASARFTQPGFNVGINLGIEI